MSDTIDNKVENENVNEILKVGRHLREIARRGASSANHEKDNTNNSLTRRFGNGARLFLAGAYLTGLIGLGGCATTGSAVQNTQSEIGYEKFYDSYGDYKIVGRDNDIYLEKLDGSESRRITNTSSIKEDFAIFSKDGNYIAYHENTDRHYIIRSNTDDRERKEISFDEISNIIEERYR